VTNAEKLAVLVERELEALEKDAAIGALIGRGIAMAGRATAGAGKFLTGTGKSMATIGKGMATPAPKGMPGLFSRIFARGAQAPAPSGKVISSASVPAVAGKKPGVSASAIRGRATAAGQNPVDYLRSRGRSGSSAAAAAVPRPIPIAPAAPPPGTGRTATPSPSGKIMVPSPTAKKSRAKAQPGAKPADAPGGSTAANVGMTGASMLIPGGSSEEGKTSMNFKAIIEKTAELAKGASDEDKVAILAQVAMGDGFDGELLSQAQALGYDAGISKTAADEKEEEEEAKEKDEKKDEKDKGEKKDLPPWLQKKTDKKDDDKDEKKDEDEKKSSARPILYNKFTAHDIAAHLQSQFGRQDPVEKDASVKKVSASEKLAALVEKELAARPT
jgi:hypothetical protein